ncbi:hypothetical protein [Paenibacillus hexagrammi]|uniref:Uncharacterized protein n=1 Tax=Paenibacillus hexagrammi TaxID=2908839 RepID=A0ABY3SFS8_9BACL|nr:hypothetical protein [Paenibacillus sp. YPD9-1]UJF32883.1 hypothetical protein L0M14_25440 [Paenibacillus sp. YPD9-1]
MRIESVHGIEQLVWQQDVTLKNVDEFRAAVSQLMERGKGSTSLIYQTSHI